jgi:hypothetical protein
VFEGPASKSGRKLQFEPKIGPQIYKQRIARRLAVGSKMSRWRFSMSELSTIQQVLLTSLEGQIERFDYLVRGLTFDQFDLSADKEAYPGTWTIREIIHHLVDDGDVWSLRIKQAIATPDVTVRLEGFPGNEVWAGHLDFEDRDVGPAVDLILAHCHYLIELLTRFSNAWNQSILLVDTQTSSERSMNILQIVQMLVEHLDEHLDQIEAIKAFNRV